MVGGEVMAAQRSRPSCGPMVPHPRNRWMLICLALLAAVGARPALAAPKTDVIILVNGDHLTGAIKGLEHNRLEVSTEHMGTVRIEWDKVARVQTRQNLLLERSDGTRYYGQLLESGRDANLLISRPGGGKSDTVEMGVIVRAQPIEGGQLLERLDGYVSGGLDFAKASDRRSFDFAGGLSSRTRRREWSLDLAANLTDDSVGRTNERYDLNGNWRRLMERRDFYQGFSELSRNTELGLDMRTLLGAGYGRYFRQSNSAEWLGTVGLAYSHENYRGSKTADSLELVLGTEFSLFRYDFPETDVTGAFAVLPSLTQAGRVRAEADLRARYEFIDDVYFELKLYGSYDSAPPGAQTRTSDYGAVTSLGYSF